MTHRMRYLSLFCLLAGSLLFSTSAWAQNVLPGPGWQVVKADWGAGNRWMDVTNQLQRLLSGNGPVRVNNANMGGDPAVGASKILRIRAVNSSRQSRQFTFKEGDTIDSRQFYNYAQGPGYRPNPGYPGPWPRISRRRRFANRPRLLWVKQSDHGRYPNTPEHGAERINRSAGEQ